MLEAPKNPNYACSVVRLSRFADLTNCDNVKAAILYGCSIIVSKDAKAGDLGLYFPVESALSKEFLGANNLFRKPELGNSDLSKRGFFEEHGRVRAVKFRGHKSEGFWVPIEFLSYLNVEMDQFEEGVTFDKVGDHEICRKYVSRRNPGRTAPIKGKLARAEDRIVGGQFRFHYDTENLRRNMHRLNYADQVSISEKWHGTSCILANVLVRRELPWYERLLKKFGVKVQEQEYGYVWSSRRVIKAVAGKEKDNAAHFYDCDIWGVVAREYEGHIPQGFTVYGEIVGYTPEGYPIQKGYSYGCEVGSHRFLVYRVTYTNPGGIVTELPWDQMKQFCEYQGFKHVIEVYSGPLASDPWEDSNFILQELEGRYVNGECPYNPGMPREGIVIRKDSIWPLPCEAYKLKNFAFLERESKLNDAGELDIETVQSEEAENA